MTVHAKVVVKAPTAINLGEIKDCPGLGTIVSSATLQALGILEIGIPGVGPSKAYVEGLELELTKASCEKLTKALRSAATLSNAGAA